MGRGKRGKSRTQRKHFQQNRENVWTSSKRSKSDPSSENPIPICNPYATQNLAFDHYYKANQTLPTYYFHTFLLLLFLLSPPSLSFAHFFSFRIFQEQGIVSSEEWDAFVQVLRTPLPAAFRINSTYFFIYFYFNCFSILTLCESSAQLSTTNELQYETN